MTSSHSQQGSGVMIPEAQYNVARDGYFEAMRQRDKARAENERLREALKEIHGNAQAISPHGLVIADIATDALSRKRP